MKQLPLVTLLVLFSAPALAYVGPGLGMGVIGTIFGVLAAIVLAVFGLFWYPLKRRFGRKKAGIDAHQTRPIVAELEQTAPPDTAVHTPPHSAADTRPINHATHHSAALNDTPDAATANRTDNPVR